MKHSIQRRLAVTFIILMIAALTSIGLINGIYLPKYYSRQKQIVLTKSWSMMNEGAGSSSEEIEQFCSVNALTYAVADSNLNFLYTNSPDGKHMASRLFGNLLHMEEENTKVLKSAEHYKIIRIYDKFLRMEFLELYGILENGNYYIVSTPLKSLGESARLSTWFYIQIGIVVTVISVGVILLLAKRLVKPIRELTELSQRMAELDFDVHYISGGKDEIGILGENFNIMSDKLEEAVSRLKSANAKLQQDIERKTQLDEMRKEFLSNVSHELKTPIALIQGYAEGLKDNINEDSESREFYCDVIVDESEKLNRMVQKLLTLNELEFGNDPVVMERFDLSELIRGIVQNNQISFAQKEAKVDVNIPGELYVWGDEFKIEEVLTNYISNALNHLDGEKQIRIRAGEADGTATISVFNTGLPIPENELEQVWEKFYKVDKARTRAYGGSGIGLSIVKAIIDGHGGSCWAENREDGVEFFFTLDTGTDL